MKDTMTTIQEFFAKHGLKLQSINLSLSIRGQIESCTGTFMYPHTAERKAVEKDYFKKMTCSDYRFFNTEMEVTATNFIITRV